MKRIKLTRGKYALVDDEDFKWLNQWKWHVSYYKYKYYVKGMPLVGEKRKHTSMHRFIMAADRGQYVDHKNGNELDNRRHNLRICSCGDNVRNQKPQKRKTSSIFKGVSWHIAGKKWVSYIQVNGKLINLGSYKDEKLAALIYNSFALEYFGEFAYFNFQDEDYDDWR